MSSKKENTIETGLEIAVIGMAGRFPGARNIEEFWNNLKNGVESVHFFSDEELENFGVSTELLKNPNRVNASILLENKEYFDASFFGYNPREAQLMDPQQRLFHEVCWQALENSGYDPFSYKGLIGLYAGSANSFLWEALTVLSGKTNDLGDFEAGLLSYGGMLSTRVSHKLDLKGPALSVFTTCSTSLVTIHLACRAIITGECDMALAGGVSVSPGENSGYMYQEGMVFSSDGHCRAFDASAKGTIFGEGIGIVVLKQFKDALACGDHIYAIVKGSAINNDGMGKVSYTAPGKKGQQNVIRTALNIARVAPESVGFIETHGTGTFLGDTIEIEALKHAFKTDKRGFCKIGSVKTNIGHLDTAAGVAGFIKAVLALKHKLIPPTLNFETPNPNIDFKNSPFYVNTQLYQWKNDQYPLRAGVSSFGIGGTNAHVILEEWSDDPSSNARRTAHSVRREHQLILLSARTQSALDRMTANLLTHVKKYPGLNLANMAYTLQVGRRPFQYRKMMVCTDVNEFIDTLSSVSSTKIKTFSANIQERTVIFMFPGQGAQYVNMGLDLYKTEPEFCKEMDHCFEILKTLVDYDIKEILYPDEATKTPRHQENISDSESEGTRGLAPLPIESAAHNSQLATSSHKIDQIEIAQIIVFIFEYSLATLLMKWGLKPGAMIGYSFGEYAAACLSGVFSLEDTLRLIVLRGKLIERVPGGGMLSVPLPIEELTPLLNRELSIAIDNGPSCIVAGSTEAIDKFEKRMKEKRYLCMRLKISRAIHSKMMEPILKEFEDMVGEITLNKPQIPYISNVTGDWLTSQEAVDPGYWSRHLRETVRFNGGIKQLIKKENVVFIELGPGRDLSVLLRRYVDINSNQKIVDTVRPEEKEISDVYLLLNKIGQLWLWAVNIDWNQFHTQEKRQRISLPTYSFDGHYFSIERDLYEKGRGPWSLQSLLGKPPKMANWFYVPTWKRSILSVDETTDELALLRWLVFIDEDGLGSRLVEAIKPGVQDLITVQVGSRFSKLKDDEYTINPHEDHDYELLFNELSAMGRYPDNILHLWGVFNDEHNPFEVRKIDKAWDLGYHSLINTAKAIGNRDFKVKIRFMVITNNMQEVLGKEQRYPEKAIILGPVKVIPIEYPNISCRSVDIMLSQPGDVEEGLLDKLLEEIAAKSIEPIVALRGNQRWVQAFEPLPLEESEKKRSLLRPGGVYLITGGFGGIGLALAQHLAQCVQAKLVLMGRSNFPVRNQWDDWLNNHNENNVVSRKIQRLQSLEELGAKVLVLRADVSKQEQVQDAMKQVWEQFGQIDGVIHAAGLPDGQVIQRRTGDDCEDILAPKIKGTWILDRILKDVKLDFFILCSSTASIHGGIGQVAYCAANNFLDAFANYKHSIGGGFTVSINWERWQNVGIATIAEDLHKKLTGKDLTGGITADEGVRTFSLILKDKLPQVIVTNRDLESLLQQSGSFKVPSLVEEFEETNISETLYQRPELQTEYIAPGNNTQQVLTDIWREFFGFEQVGIADDFFELGGDSLKALFILPKIHKKLGVQLPVAEFFKRPTIHQLTEYIEQAEKSTYSSIEPVEKKEYYSLSSAQMRLYIMQMMERGSVSYNEPEIKILEGPLSRGKLEEVFKRLIRRHECLRTSIEMVNGEPVQKIQDNVEFEIEYYDLQLTGASDRCRWEEAPFWQINAFGGSDGKENTEGTRGLAPLSNPTDLHSQLALGYIKDFVRPFDLSQAPLLRVGLIKEEDTRHILMMDMHHIISDAISFEILVKDIITLYEGEELSPLRLQYKDYSEWKNSDLEKEKMERQQEYWTKMFEKGVPVLNLPTDYPRPGIQSFEGSSLHFSVGKDETEKLRTLIAEEEVTPYMLLLTTLYVFLSKISGQMDIVIGSSIACRVHEDLKGIIGLFANNIALRNYPKPDKTFKEFLKEVKTKSLEAFENQEFHYEELVEKVIFKRDFSRNPLFDVLFEFHDMKKTGSGIPGITLKPYAYDSKTVKLDLSLVAIETEKYLSFTFIYCTKLFKLETIEKFGNYYKRIVSSILENPGKKLFEIKIMEEKEREKKLNQFNDDLENE